MKSIPRFYLTVALAAISAFSCVSVSPQVQEISNGSAIQAEYEVPQDSPLRKHPLAKVKKILGEQAFIVSHLSKSEKKPLQEGMEISLFDLIETGNETQVEISIIDRSLLFKDNLGKGALKYSSTNFLRLDSNSKGSIKYLPLSEGGAPLLTFVLECGKILVHIDLQEHQIATRTKNIDCRPWGDIYLVESSNEGSSVFVLSGAVDITLAKRKPSVWIAHLIRGEQLLPMQIGSTSLDLDTTTVTENNYSINKARKTEPLITRFAPFPPSSQKALSVWGDRQEYRWADYVRTRNEQRRDLKRTIERIIPSSPSNTVIIESPKREIP